MCSNCSGDYENPDMTVIDSDDLLPLEAEDALEQDRRVSGSYAKGCDDMARALDLLVLRILAQREYE